MVIYETLFYIAIAGVSFMFVSYATNRLQNYLDRK